MVDETVETAALDEVTVNIAKAFLYNFGGEHGQLYIDVGVQSYQERSLCIPIRKVT
jgi:hypothetical protein